MSIWACAACTFHNPLHEQRCGACGSPVPSPAVSPRPSAPPAPTQRAASGPQPRWMQLYDPKTGKPYYYDEVNGVTQWKRPDNFVARPPSSPQLPQPDTQPTCGGAKVWSCHACTFENQPASQNCEICGQPKQGTVRRGKPQQQQRDDSLLLRQNSCPGFSLDRQQSEWLHRVRSVEKDLPRGGHWRDETFPPNIESIYGQEMCSLGPADEGVTEWDRYFNLRGNRFSRYGSREPWSLAKPDPSLPGALLFCPDAIAQGALGDCWFLSALAVICTRQELIRRIFISDSLNPSGVYCLRFWHNGVWTPVMVDDYLPKNSRNGIAFASGKGNELWPSLVEKAYAKLHRSYRAICSGTARDALTDLTGAPCSKLDLEKDSSDDDLWPKLESSYRSGCLMSAACGKKGCDKEAYRAMGLVSNHCYAVMCVEDIALGGGKSLKLVRLKNPWGQEEWKGDWSDKSSLWTPDIKRKLSQEFRPQNDGTFYMAFSDFLDFFSCVDVCRTHEDWHATSLSDWFTRKAVDSNTAQFSNAYLISVTSPTWIYISIVQQVERGADESYEYKDAGMTVVRITRETHNLFDPEHFELVAAKMPAVQRINTCDTILRPGKYLVFPFSLLNKGRDIPYTLALWSSKEVKIKKMSMKSAGLHPLVSSVHKMFSFKELKPTESYPYAGVRLVQITNSHGIWYFAENRTNIPLNVALDCEGTHGLVSIRGKEKTEDTVPPGGAMLLQVLTAIQQHAGWRSKHKVVSKWGRSLPVVHDPPLPREANLHFMLFDPTAMAQAFR